MSIRTAKALVTVLALAGLFALASAAPAATYLVRPNGSGDYATIQDAIVGVVDTDIIELADGTFDGTGNRDLDFLGKAITIRSQSGDPEACIINCGGDEFDPHRAFWFHSGEGSSSVVQDISVVNGFLTDANGGAVLCDGASPTFDGCVFGNNIIHGADVRGGAVYCEGSSQPAFTGCRFVGNTAGESPNGKGGAIALSCVAVTLTDCTIGPGNYAGSHGGGLHADLTPAVMTDCTVTDNSADFGAGVCTEGGGLTMTGCSLLWNMALGASQGGGVAVFAADLDMTGCTLMGNMAMGGGGGILFGGTATGDIANTIVAYSSGGGIKVLEPGRAVTVTCCDVFENMGGNYLGGISDQTGINDNISEDALFCNAPSGDLTLYNTSPCAPANSPCGQLIGAEDVDCFTAVESSSWGKIKSSFE
ncbi:right-handed parallel beta-helix repeat-containing protein [bacterium]|nr:right-handed parallel beta-helix repeat-containing protein [bacterium]